MNTDFLSKEADSNVLASELIETCGLPVNTLYLFNNISLFLKYNAFYTSFLLNKKILSLKNFFVKIIEN